MIYNAYMYMYVLSLLSLLIIRNHIFLCLMSLEFLVISLLMFFMFNFSFILSGVYTVVYMMIFFVCEGVLGLSVLVSMIRCHGNDYLNSLILW
uniref:NADH dehydrogenase subunit 4L n=1 Tax=Arrugada affinis TaxID=706857 RepID=UPI002E78DD44|nr:NADH dehydrogenase subunit 4L [Arrugada affinis]WRK21423.1 NADH dehydrogenase subunit 4L [Arrugada affinis]